MKTRLHLASLLLLLLAGPAYPQVPGTQPARIKDPPGTTLLKGSGTPIYAIAISPDARTLVASNEQNQILFWDINQKKLVATVDAHKKPISRLRFSDNGKLLVTASEDGTSRVYNAANRELLSILKGHRHHVHDVAFSPDSKLIATASCDYTVRIWDANKEKCLRTIELDAGSRAIAWSPDGKTLAAECGINNPEDGGSQLRSNIVLIDQEAAKVVATTDGKLPMLMVRHVEFSGDSKSVWAFALDRATLFDVTGGEFKLRRNAFFNEGAAVSTSPQRLLGKSMNGMLVGVPTSKNEALPHCRIPTPEQVGTVAITPNGRFAAYSFGRPNFSEMSPDQRDLTSTDFDIRFIDLDALLALSYVLDMPEIPVKRVGSPSTFRIASQTGDFFFLDSDKLMAWNPATKNTTLTMQTDPASLLFHSWNVSPDSRYLYTAGRSALLYDLTTKKKIWDAPSVTATRIQFSTDVFYHTASDKTLAKVPFNALTTPQALLTLKDPIAEFVVTPDEKQAVIIASPNRKMRSTLDRYDLATGKVAAHFDFPASATSTNGRLTWHQLSPRGRYAVWSEAPATRSKISPYRMNFIDTQTGQPLPGDDFRQFGLSVTFAHDDSRVLVSHEETWLLLSLPDRKTLATLPNGAGPAVLATDGKSIILTEGNLYRRIPVDDLLNAATTKPAPKP